MSDDLQRRGEMNLNVESRLVVTWGWGVCEEWGIIAQSEQNISLTK